MRKIIFIDTETTGFIPSKSAITQLSGVVRIDKKDMETFNFYIKPFEGADINQKALEVQGRTLEDFKNEKFISEEKAYFLFKKILDKYVNKYDKNDKFIVAGYNVKFDVDMLQAFFKRQKDNYLFSYISLNNMLDPLPCIGMLQLCGLLPELENNKLETWCKYFGIEFEAHDSLEDICATKELIFKIANLIIKK